MKALSPPILLALAVLAFSAAPAAAQRLHIDIGGGHGHYHGHHHHHGYHWGPSFYYGYYSPPPVTYVYPAPVRREITYVVPQAATASSAASGLARVEARPNALPAAPTGTVVIANPANSGTVVGFVVDEKTEVSLQPGESRVLSNSTSYLVEYDRGGNFGIARRTLGQGSFEFIATNSGWDLVSRSTAAAQQADVRPSVKRNDLPKLR